MKDSSNNEVRFYKVIYERNLHTGNRITCTNEAMSEFQLQSMLYDFESRYQYLVLSATYLPNFTRKDESE